MNAPITLPEAFAAFPSLENTYRQNMIARVEQLGFHDEAYIVTEKLHGANFSFHVSAGVDVDQPVVKVARRTAILEEGENFFNYRPVLAKYQAGLVALFNHLQSQEHITTLSVYGELFGGNIGSGMCYPLEQDFAAFDVVVDGVPLHKLTAFSYLVGYNIKVVPLVTICKNLHDALNISPAFTSHVKREGFDGAEEHCEAEGVVIEPVTPRWYNAEKRIYFKQKTARFLETGGNKVQKPAEVLPPELEGILLQGFNYITHPRFEAVASKVGLVTIKDIGKLTGLFTQDLLIDMQKDGLDVPDSKVFMRCLQRQVQSFLRITLLSFEGV